ncbi:helix-turn-helix domain-containing protein [Cetobacterium sp.]|uniref:helix-turn-helix domain-containing protein n=1 Tax=Cetobacterium sp. TaxID=2071632 RepID=UPI003EE80771
MYYQKIYLNIENKILSKYKKIELAKKMGIKPQTLNTILNNIKTGKANLKTLERIANAGEIKTEELLS